MTAPIVFHLSRNPVELLGPYDGDAVHVRLEEDCGQLWERLAELQDAD